MSLCHEKREILRELQHCTLDGAVVVRRFLKPIEDSFMLE